jgi:dihydrofolate reductase
MIWAQGTNGELGLNGQLPWKLPADMKYFKDVTTGCIVVMGRKTFDSFGDTLIDRSNVVLTRDIDEADKHPDAWYYNSHIKLMNDLRKSNVFIIGGKQIYDLFMPFADKLFVTVIHAEFEADTYAPGISSDWLLDTYEEGTVDEDNIYPHSFITYRRRTK